MKNILYMAPILGVTNCIYRSVYARVFKGYDVAIAPFIASCFNGRIKRGYMRDILPERNTLDFKLIPQILSKSSTDFITLSTAMFDLGYNTVNWNLGCPLPKIRKKMRGSGLLCHPDVVDQFLNDVIPRIPNKLSVKVRLGCEDSTDLGKLMPILNTFPLEEIIVHPRTGKQMYRGKVDLDVFEKCLRLSNHTIVYNGDIYSLKDFNALTKRFPTIKRWMMGRGGITNPFLPEMIKGVHLKKEQQLEKFILFHDALFYAYQQELSGPAHVMDKMKEVWSYWHLMFDGGKDLYLKICRYKKITQYTRQFLAEKILQFNNELV